MVELTTQELMIFVVLGFCAGIFTTFYLARLFEIVHMWRLLQEVLARILLMCVYVIEDVEFLKQLKQKHLRAAEFTPEQIKQFEEVDERTLTNWKNSVILSIINTAHPSFRALMPFNNWEEAVRFLEKTLKVQTDTRRSNYEVE